MERFDDEMGDNRQEQEQTPFHRHRPWLDRPSPFQTMPPPTIS